MAERARPTFTLGKNMVTNLLGDKMGNLDFKVGDVYRLRYGGRPIVVTVVSEEEADTAHERGWVKCIGIFYIPVKEKSSGQIRMMSKALLNELATQVGI